MKPKDAFTAISTATKIAAPPLRNSRHPVRLGVHLSNVFKRIVVLTHHIGE